jgi:hypothetical protein
VAKKSKKQVRKLYDKVCFFCGIADYDLLDAHRIYEGSEGGTYHWLNMLTTCVLCHRKVHTGKIQILGQHPSTSGRWVVHYIDEKGEEKWVPH